MHERLTRPHQIHDYEEFKNQLLHKAGSATSTKACYLLIKDYVNFFKDKHFRIEYYGKIDSTVVNYYKGDLDQKLMEYLLHKGIQTRVLPPSLNKAPQFNEKKTFKNSEYFAKHGMYLPSGPDQSEGDIKMILEYIKEFDGLIT